MPLLSSVGVVSFSYIFHKKIKPINLKSILFPSNKYLKILEKNIFFCVFCVFLLYCTDFTLIGIIWFPLIYFTLLSIFFDAKKKFEMMIVFFRFYRKEIFSKFKKNHDSVATKLPIQPKNTCFIKNFLLKK